MKFFEHENVDLHS